MVDSFSDPLDIGGMYSLGVYNISFRTTAADLLPVFGRYGTVGNIYVPQFHQPYRRVGFAFVRYYSRWSAEEALYRADGNLVLDGRQLRVERHPFGWPEPEQAHRRRSFDYASHCSGDTGGGSRRSPSPCRQRHHGRSRSNDREKPRKSLSPCRQRLHGRSRSNDREEPRPRRRRARSGSHSHAPHAGDGRGGSGQSSGMSNSRWRSPYSSPDAVRQEYFRSHSRSPTPATGSRHSHAPHVGDGRGGSGQSSGMSRSRCRSPYSSPDSACQVYFRSRSRSPTGSRGSPLQSSPQRSPGGARQRSYSRSRSLLRLAEQPLFINDYVHYR